MAQVAHSLLKNLSLSESDDGDHRPSKTTSLIISLMENGVINDDAIISLLLSHHRQADKIQQQQAVHILANLCFNRLTAFLSFILNVYLVFIFIFIAAKMASSFTGEKDWEFTQIFMKIYMEMSKQD
ncbi:unnamed protein product [Rotaria sp. Silwood2]|nr:unnamed protein product [Rotaria sp. Silwood2]